MQRLRADTIICDILSKHQMRKEKKNKKKIIKMEHKAKEDKKKNKTSDTKWDGQSRSL